MKTLKIDAKIGLLDKLSLDKLLIDLRPGEYKNIKFSRSYTLDITMHKYLISKGCYGTIVQENSRVISVRRYA